MNSPLRDKRTLKSHTLGARGALCGMQDPPEMDLLSVGPNSTHQSALPLPAQHIGSFHSNQLFTPPLCDVTALGL